MERVEKRRTGLRVDQSVATNQRLLDGLEHLDTGHLADLHREHLRGRHDAELIRLDLVAMTELVEGMATPMPRPDSASAMATTHVARTRLQEAKSASDAVRNVAPAIALTRSPMRTAT